MREDRTEHYYDAKPSYFAAPEVVDEDDDVVLVVADSGNTRCVKYRFDRASLNRGSASARGQAEVHEFRKRCKICQN